MFRKPVEHYIVKPNRKVRDWHYEYSDGSKIKDCDCCNIDSDRLSISIDNLRTALQRLQSSMDDMPIGGVDKKELASIIAEIINQTILESNDIASIIEQQVISKVQQISSGISNISVNNKTLEITTSI